MRKNFFSETEIPGAKVNRDQLQIICHRYRFAAKYAEGKDALEVGCGPGLGIGYLAKKAKSVVGADIDPQNVEIAEKNHGKTGKIMRMDAHKMPFPDGSFDVIICIATIIYLDLPVFFDECRRVLKKDGTLVLNTPNRDMPTFKASRLSRGYLSVPELNKVLEEHGFTAEFSGAFDAPARRGVKDALKGVARTLLERIPGGGKIRAILAGSVAGRNITLPEGVDDELIRESGVDDIPTTAQPKDSKDTKHRIIYIVAHPRMNG